MLEEKDGVFIENILFTKENLDNYLKELSKEYRKQSGLKTPGELILVGGASVLLKYNFRASTGDVDAVIIASTAMKDAINITSEKFNLPNGWLNSDFKNTASFSDKLYNVSKFYRKYSNALEIRTISDEYLIAMKLKSFRNYKHDLSDIVGILYENKINNNEIILENIKKAVLYLYDKWENISEIAQNMIEDVFKDGDYKKLYDKYRKYEEEMSGIKDEFNEKYPGQLRGKDMSVILEQFKESRDNSSG